MRLFTKLRALFGKGWNLRYYKTMRTADDVRVFLESNKFVNRYHAFAFRAVVRDKFEGDNFNFRWQLKSQEGERLITANDALDFLISK